MSSAVHEKTKKDLIVLGNQNYEAETQTEDIMSCDPSFVQSDRLEISQSIPDEVAGPAIQLHNKIMTFEQGTENEIETFLYFDKFRGKMAIEHIRINNVGCTTLYYNWEKVHMSKSYSSQRNDQTQEGFQTDAFKPACDLLTTSKSLSHWLIALSSYNQFEMIIAR